LKALLLPSQRFI